MKDALLLSTEALVEAPKRFVREALRMRDGHEIDWYYVDTPPSVMVVPVTAAGDVVFVRQYRHNLKLDTLELPAGLIAEGEPPSAAALRELTEETGYTLTGEGSLHDLGRYYALPSETNKYVHVFLATPVHQSTAPTGDTEIERYFDMSTTTIPFAVALEEVGRTIHGLETAAALLLSRRLL
ncbi:NUDIX hydrolase [Dactylosporangium sp. CA-233914]|uniref:NUDIX hydrolase n=1 Tax=Dactylosporangium sp. CA-233914 TaxID=3239934 RepID=UPI003D929CE3